MSVIAIIPARGGSKRILNKNTIDFFGKPMIIWTLEAAKKTKLFSKIVVSTESDLIREVVEKYGFEVIIRPEEFATDEATLNPVLLNVFEQLESKGQYFKDACLLMANCPIRDDKDIIESYSQYKKSSTNLLMSVFEYGMFYPFWALENTKKGLKPFFGEKYIRTRSQDLPQVYCPTGAIRWVNISAFKKEKDFYGDNLQPYVLPWYKGIDIDDEADLDIAKMIYSYYNEQNKNR